MNDLYEYDDEMEYDVADEWAPEDEYEAEADDSEYEFETDGGMDEMQLASELLEITDDEELEQFLGSLVKRASRSVGHFPRSNAGRTLGGLLKKTAKKALPGVGSAIGGYFGGSAGAKIGSQLASSAGRIFGLELEGMSPEDQEFEAALRVIRLSKSAANQLARQPQSSNPVKAAKAALLAASKRHAPGLVASGASSRQACPHCGFPRSGRWVRKGPHILIINGQG
jgi:hypothetical protein